MLGQCIGFPTFFVPLPGSRLRSISSSDPGANTVPCEVPAEDVIHGVFHAQLASLESDAHGSLELHAAGLSFGDTQSRVMLAQTCGDDLDIRGVRALCRDFWEF